MKRTKISFTDNLGGVIVTMAEGNPGALTVLMQLVKDDPMGFMDVLNLDDMDMRGPQIWIAYKDHCKGDIEAFRKAVRDRDPEMVKTVNESRGNDPAAPKAVVHGASYSHV